MSKVMHHPTKGQKMAYSDEQAEELHAQGWRDNPGEYGLETAPGESPDPAIEANGEKYKAEQAAVATPVPKAP